MQTRPRTGASILPAGLLEYGKLYTLAQLSALGPQLKSTTAYTTDAGLVVFDGSTWSAVGSEAGLPLASNSSIAFTEGVSSITAEVVPGQFATLDGNNVLEGSLALGGLVADTSTTKQNDSNPADFANGYNLRSTGAASIGYSGFLAQVEGYEFLFENHTSLANGYLRWLEHESTASATANNRIQIPRSGPLFMFPGDSVVLRENLSAQRWRVKGPVLGKMFGLTEFNDFVTEAPSGFVSGSGASIANASASNWSSFKGHGAATISTGTTTTGRAGLGAVGTNLAANVIPGHGPMMFLSSLIPATAPDGTETYTLAVGFHDGQDGTIDNGCYWEGYFDGSAAVWSQTVMSAGTPTRRTTNSPAFTTSATLQFGVFYSGDGLRADFIKSEDGGKTWTLAGSVTTGVPAVSGSGIMSACTAIIKSAGTTARTALVDYIGFRADSVRA